MPNLTDVLEDEDKSTVEEIAKLVCLPIAGGTMVGSIGIPVLKWVDFAGTQTETSGFRWTLPNGIWTSQAIHGTGFVFGFDSDIKFDILPDAGRLSNRNAGLYWENEKVLVSAPIASADAVENIMSLTQTDYDLIGSPVATTLYVITGP